ncbi:MAG: hypothetical protein Q9199_002282 [Rusavskia elegans]
MEQPSAFLPSVTFRHLKARQLSIEDSEAVCEQTVSSDRTKKVHLPLWASVTTPIPTTFSAVYDPDKPTYTLEAVWTRAVGHEIPIRAATAIDEIPTSPPTFHAYIQYSLLVHAVTHHLEKCRPSFPEQDSEAISQAVAGVITKKDGVNREGLTSLEGLEIPKDLEPYREAEAAADKAFRDDH